MHAERMVNVSQATLRDAFTGVPCFVQDVVNALVTQEGRIAILRKKNRLQAMLHDRVNKVIEDEFKLVEYENRLLCKIDDVKLSTRHLRRVTEKMLNNHDFIGPVITTVITESMNAEDVE